MNNIEDILIINTGGTFNKVYDETKIDRTDKIKLGSIKLKKLQLKK